MAVVVGVQIAADFVEARELATLWLFVQICGALELVHIAGYTTHVVMSAAVVWLVK